MEVTVSVFIGNGTLPKGEGLVMTAQPYSQCRVDILLTVSPSWTSSKLIEQRTKPGERWCDMNENIYSNELGPVFKTTGPDNAQPVTSISNPSSGAKDPRQKYSIIIALSI